MVECVLISMNYVNTLYKTYFFGNFLNYDKTVLNMKSIQIHIRHPLHCLVEKI